jgi:predicted RNA methylase
LVWILGNVLRKIKSDGVHRTAKLGGQRLLEQYHDCRFGIRTSGFMNRNALEYNNPNYHNYCATDYKSFRRVMKHVKIKKNEDIFLDYGSGMGRILILAGAYPFRQIIGVEVSAKLNQVAMTNVERVKKRLICKNIEIVEADATTCPLPPGVTVIYFYNPFSGAALAQVLDNIQQSLTDAPRQLTIVYKNPPYFEQESIKHGWLVKRAEFTSFSEHKYVIYESKQ